jgi:Tfp pilus assembly protein PilO
MKTWRSGSTNKSGPTRQATDRIQPMDLKDPKTQKIILAGIGLFLVVYFWHAKVYKGYESKIYAHTQQYEQIRTELKNVEMKFRSLASLKEEYRDLTRRYRMVERLLPEAQSVPDFLSQIHSAALESNSQILEVNPLGIKPEDFFNQDAYRVSMNTTYHDLGVFLAGVANFPFIVSVSNFELQEFLDDRSGAEKEKESYTVTAFFTLTAYFVQDSERLVLFDI